MSTQITEQESEEEQTAEAETETTGSDDRGELDR